MRRIALSGFLVLLCALAPAQSVTADSLNLAGPATTDSTKVTSIPKVDTAQIALDLIIFRNADEINCKVVQIDSKEVYYKSPNNDVLYTCQKDRVLMIRYSNGTKEVFRQDVSVESDRNPEMMRSKGRQDATNYYRGERGGAGGTFIVTFLLGPIIGLIPASACTSTPPKTKNMITPNRSLLSNADYISGYQEAALPIKKRKIWRSYGAACLTLLGLLVIIAATSH